MEKDTKERMCRVIRTEKEGANLRCKALYMSSCRESRTF